jgi:GDP-L-fucose synthase
VDDLADACLFLLQRADPPDWINVGTGTDVTIRELAQMVAEATGYKGAISWDASMPDGTPRKLLDVSRMSALGWTARIGLREGIGAAYRSFLAESQSGRLRE